MLAREDETEAMPPRAIMLGLTPIEWTQKKYRITLDNRRQTWTDNIGFTQKNSS